VSDAPVVLVFDIDGTLLDSVAAHQAALLAAYISLGLNVGDRPFSAFPDHTDSAIFDLLVEEACGERASAAQFEQLNAQLSSEYARRVAAELPPEIAGARTLLAALAADARFRVTFATGSMRGVATQKLSQLGVDTDVAALVTASDFLTREEIVARAITLAARPDQGSERVLALGDGIWDQITAARLGIPFLAIESGSHRFEAGPVHTVPDLRSLTPDALIALADGHDVQPFQPSSSKE
jgi:phosphoglycolate phosphatase-like HAD superfamily hydrolase